MDFLKNAFVAVFAVFVVCFLAWSIFVTMNWLIPVYGKYIAFVILVAFGLWVEITRKTDKVE